MEHCPRPKDEEEKTLGFRRQKMVDWFSPGQLIDTAIKTLLASTIESYADKREVQAALDESCEPYSYVNEGDKLWFDYTADLGDGWNSTYSIALMLGQQEQSVHDSGVVKNLPRGRFLVMGGDQVYPTASRDEYKNRLKGPYQAALPCVEDESQRPHLYAIPGNHDWYDGLSNFLKIFREGQSLGGWLAKQRRSYFALQLPQNWWVVAVDIALGGYIDTPQLEYFKKICKQFKPGDNVILCVAEPSWIYAAGGIEEGYNNLRYVQEKLIEACGAKVRLTLAGDLHHYAHYQRDDGQMHRITSGGGGAFLHPTQQLPNTISLEESQGKADYQRKTIYPSAKRSRTLLSGNLLFPFKHMGLSAFLGGVYLVYAWLFQSISLLYTLDNNGDSFLGQLVGRDLGGAFSGFINWLERSPGMMLLVLLLLSSLVLFCEPIVDSKARLWMKKVLVGSLHGIGHISLMLFLYWIFAHLNNTCWQLQVTDRYYLYLFAIEVFVSGAIAGGMLFGLYLFASNVLLGFHSQTAYSALAIEDYKHFLRMSIDEKGLTIYVLAVTKIPRRWRFVRDGNISKPWFSPVGRELSCHLIDKIEINK